MKNYLFNFLLKFFNDEIENYFIEEGMKEFKFSKKEKSSILEKLSDLYLYPEYKLYSKIISNRARHLAIQGMKLKYSTDKEYSIEHSFLRGRVFEDAYLVKLIKYSNKRYQGKNNARSKKV